MLSATFFREQQCAVWGDSFVEDGFSSIAFGANWETITSDELFRFIPNCKKESSVQTLPEPIERAFRRFIEASMSRDIPVPSCDLPSHAMAFTIVEKLVNSGGDVAPLPFDEIGALSVAIFTGVHPAYIWPMAIVAHDRFATFTWLGHLAKSKCALVPLEVAHYLLDVLLVSGKEFQCIDLQLAPFVPKGRGHALIKAARQRANGRSVVFRDRVALGFFRRWWRTL